MPRLFTRSALVLLLSALAGAASAQTQQRSDAINAKTDCDEACQQKRLADAAATLRVVSCGRSACPPGPPFLDKRGQLVLPPPELERVIRGMAIFASSQGLTPQQLAARVAQVKLP